MKALQILLPCAVKPVGVVLIGEVGDEQRIGAGERATLHPYLNEHIVGVVIPVESDAREFLPQHEMSLALLVMTPFVTPREGEFVAVGGDIVRQPFGVTFCGANQFPNDIG